MANVNGISAYQQAAQPREAGTVPAGSAKAAASSAASKAAAGKASAAGKTDWKSWSPIESGSSLIPQKTDYGYTIGDVQLSDKAKDYYEQLKSKFHNLEFIAVSKDMKAQVQKNAAAYGNANKMVVLIDEEKLERMATDEAYRNKYEGIIAMSQSKLAEAKNSLAGTGANIKNFGMTVDENGNEKFFATVEKSLQLQKERIEKKAEEKKEQKAQEKKQAEKERAEKVKAEKDPAAKETDAKTQTEEAAEPAEEPKEYIRFEANSMEELLTKIRDYSYQSASARVRTESERMIGSNFDFKG